MNVHYNDKLAGEALDKALAEHNPQVLVVRSTKVPDTTIDCGSGLQVIVRAGAGTDTINVAHAAKRGIYVANCPGKNANAVSELTIGLMISIDRRMAEQNELLKQGKWCKGNFVNQKGLKDRTLGIIGFGAIGQRVCKAALAMEMKVLVCSRTKKDDLDSEMGFTYADKETLL
jgi:D-3-phosphoglycerate dehydrogenase